MLFDQELLALLEGMKADLDAITGGNTYYQVDTIDLNVIHNQTPIAGVARPGRTLAIATMSVGTAATIRLSPGLGDIPLREGLYIDDQPFTDVLITNAAQGAGTTVVILTAGR